MCKTVWLGTCAPLGGLPAALGRRDPVEVASHFRSLVLTCVGSHEGCGCGFFSDADPCDGLEFESEVQALAGALLGDEQARFDAECASRMRLWAAVRAALAHGPVEVYACWMGDETKPALGRAALSLEGLEGLLEPFQLGVECLIQ